MAEAQIVTLTNLFSIFERSFEPADQKTKNILLDYSTKAKRLVEGSHSDLTSKEVVSDAISKPFNPTY